MNTRLPLLLVAITLPHLAKAEDQPATVPRPVVELAREAKAAFEEGNYKEAEKAYLQAKVIQPRNLYILSNLGVSQFRQLKFKAAEATLKEALAVAPGDSFCLCTLGIVYYQQQRFDEAIATLTSALKIDLKNTTAGNYLELSNSQKDWEKEAKAELESGTKKEPKDKALEEVEKLPKSDDNSPRINES